jgi:hypothetical protein
MSFASLRAQDEFVLKGTKQISKDLTPHQVIDSLHKNFPDAQAARYYKTAPDGINNGWAVTKDDNLHVRTDIDYYTISFKRDNMQYYGLYQGDGTLLESKIQEDSAHLPDAVKNALQKISEKYPGYKVVSKTYYKKTDFWESKEYFEIVTQKGKAKKTFYYTPSGELVKVK